jgi:hypothetical protein
VSSDEQPVAASEEEQLLPKKKAKGKDDTRKNSGKMPTNKEIKEWVEHYVGCFNLNMVSTNHALTTAGDKFQCNMMDKKPMIKELLKDIIFEQCKFAVIKYNMQYLLYCCIISCWLLMR